MSSRDRFNLKEEDLLGFEFDEVSCKNCSDLCGYKTPRLYRDRPVVICGNKESGRAVLANFKPRK